MVRIIYHLADIHIPNNVSRHEEYREVFKRVYMKLEADKEEKLIVICGDLFHDKTNLKPEPIKFFFGVCWGGGWWWRIWF